MEGYKNSLEHLLEALQRIDLLVRCQILRCRMADQSGADEFRGLYITEAEIDTILTGREADAPQPEEKLAQLQALLEYCTTLGTTMATKIAVSQSQGTELRLACLQALFDLSPLDIDVLLICLAPEIDLKYEKLYAYLQDDVTKKRPSVDLCLQLLCPSLAAKLEARQRFTLHAPLLKQHLLYVLHDPAQPQLPLLSRSLRVDERIVDYLLGIDTVEARLLPYARLLEPRRHLADMLLPTDVLCRLAQLAQGHKIGETGWVLYLQGPYGVGKQATAEALCQELGIKLLVVDGERLVHAQDISCDTAVCLVAREALLQGAALYWDGFDALLADDRRVWRDVLLRALEQRRGWTMLAGNTPWEPRDTLHHTPFVRLELPRPTYVERVRLWEKALTGVRTDADLEALANQFRLSGGQIQDAAATAWNLVRWRDPEQGQVTMDDLAAACRLQSNRTLAALAQKRTPHYTWDDIVLPADRLQQLREICHYVRYRALVYDAWGFDRKLALGKGLNVLFAGPSGTGKTMAAEIMAGELGLELYKIDLSTVISKYIGETEKNLARIFAEAETSNAILFFDEADALFGKRSEVRDAHDRYANIEVGYLLQKMEEYEGVVILATNLRKNMDEAFVRRIHVTVEFPFPSEKERRHIWERIWPLGTPRRAELDLDFMARRFELAGGSIRNIALAAAFLAAADGGVVGMEQLLHATRREYQKMGKVVEEKEFRESSGATTAR